MKKTLVIFTVLFVLMCGMSPMTVFGEGGKNHGEVGTGETSTGVDNQGDAAQDRTGR
ncbi:MAG: hypothetical protein JXO48_06745 [Deltaproteobacteria bacterium]|nr:hypothetical protein [Deltaproteobacteria bacterium]